ncbi:hypothetical protein [Pontiella sulfatireligans]|uniref:Outer membrane lipoprotein-sorting protein n=1 Tax=Pontiella sulfatireligans TaxID=2750658 RepID=A0A6C2URH9_9BACT|nr:hypothetical protein [Pontiella sulfatireligans]VGO22553.1 hypothetical protein SCARR_04637 [Pontiella sulfatireligans]
MKTTKLFIPALALLLLALSASAGVEVDRLLAEYSKIETVTCQIRRTKEGAAGKIKFLSRVYWTSEGQLHAEGISPIKRRTIANGTRLWQYTESSPKGFSRPIDKLSKQMQISLRMVPGTAMDNLLHLVGHDETALPAEGDAVKRIGIATDKRYAVLMLDAQNRLFGIKFYPTPEMAQLIAEYEYSDFTEPVPGVWVPLTHQASIQTDNVGFKETVKVDRFIANKPVAESLFIESSFFDKNIDFVDDFAKISTE